MKFTLLIVAVLYFYFPVEATEYSLRQPAAKENSFIIGLKGGINFTQPVILKKYQVISPLTNDIDQSGVKEYNSLFGNFGYQYAFTLLYRLRSNLDIRLEPTFSTYNYRYSLEFFWETGTTGERIDMTSKHKQTLKYIEIPVTVRYLIGNNLLRPFIQAGIFYGYLQNALKSATTEETYTNPSGTSVLDSESFTGNAAGSYIRSRYGINAGIGLDYETSLFNLTFDINLNFGLNNIVNKSARYSTQQYSSGMYDVQDNTRLIIPQFNVGILFPVNKPLYSKLKCVTK